MIMREYRVLAYVSALDVFFVTLDLLLQLIKRNFVVHDNQVDLQLLDTETDLNEAGTAPNKTICKTRGLNQCNTSDNSE